jgi:hypothetical protein
MPLAVTGLTDQQYQTLQRWLASGAPIDEQGLVPSAKEALQVVQWENLFNAPGARQSLVGRWLFEHWFLAHIYFKDGEPGHFFQWVRSRTPTGQPIDLINTRRPNDDPGTQFYYRLWPVQGVIVHKTHITYALSAAKMARVKSLFYNGNWQVNALPGYGPERRANPFSKRSRRIPAQARYQFMLDNAEYFVRTFIRGPVCRGQIATDVIRDNFWALFQAPEHDLYITDPNYRGQATPLLAMPGQNDDVGSVLSLWHDYRDKRNDYEALRRDSYAELPAPSWSTLWAGNDNALLSIFRHFRQRVSDQRLDRRCAANDVVVRLPLAGAHLLSVGGEFRRIWQRLSSGPDEAVFRSDPQRCRAELPAPDAGRFAGRLSRRLVSEQRQIQDVAGL